LEALSHKDSSELARLLQDTRAPKPLVDALCELPGLHGSKEVFARARALPGFQSAARALGSLEELVLRLDREGLSDRIVVDLGETLTAPYYTGMMFQVLADGPGQALLSGGRYDELFGRFGRGMAAAGAAIHIDHLRWALASRGCQRPPRVMVSAATHPGESSLEAEVRSVLEALRAAGVPASRDLEPWLHADLRAFARESGFGYVASVQKGGAVEMLDASDGTLTPCSLNEFLESVGKN
jgi:ATP phosphoribosyltransferase regulatory subunit